MKTEPTVQSQEELNYGITDTYFSWLRQQEKEIDRYWAEIFIKRKRMFYAVQTTKIGNEEKKAFLRAEIKEAQKNLSDETITHLYTDLNLPYNDLIETVTTFRKTVTEFAAIIEHEKIPEAEHIRETAKILSRGKVKLNKNVFSKLMVITEGSRITSDFFVPVLGKNHPAKAVCSALFSYHHEKQHLNFLVGVLNELEISKNIELKSQLTSATQKPSEEPAKLNDTQNYGQGLSQNLVKQTETQMRVTLPEMELLAFMRRNKYEKVTVYYRDNVIDIIEGFGRKTVPIQLKKILREHKYQDIELKLDNGKIIAVRQTVKTRIIKSE